ncbi:MAG: lysophospholipid acyltransferase family protein [Promethearchaeota archaeon]
MKQKIFPFREWSFLHRAFYCFARAIVPRWPRFFFNFDIYGVENIHKLPEGVPVIFCGNHQSHLDSILFASAIVKPYGPRLFLAFMASGKAMVENKFFGLTHYLGAFPVFKEDPKPALSTTVKLLKHGYAVYISPQGKRVGRTPFHDFHNLVQEGRTGVGRIILKTNGKVPIVPFYLHGAYEALRSGQFLPRFKANLSIRIGKPLVFKEYTRSQRWKESDPDFFPTAREIVDKIMWSIRFLMLIEEKYYFDLVEKVTKAPLERIPIPSYKSSFNWFLRKTTLLQRKQLQKMLET